MGNWRVQAREDHFVVLGANGDEMLVSVKEYASPASAKRAAKNAYEALTGDVEFETVDADGNVTREDVSESSAGSSKTKKRKGGKGGRIQAPEPGSPRHALSPLAQ